MQHLGNWLRDYVAGWIGGIAGLLAGHPFETVKIRQQTRGHGLINIVTITYTHEGFSGFYKGMGFPLLTVGTLNAIFFGVYSNVLRLLQKNYEDNSRLDMNDPMWKLNVFTAGVAAGFVQVLCGCPIEVIKSKMQVSHGGLLETYWKLNYPKSNFACENTFMIVKDTYHNKGIKGFYSGVVPMLWRDLFGSGVYILSYEYLVRDVFPEHFPKLDKRPMLSGMIAGGLAGVCSWSTSVPFDVVKSRMQTDDALHPQYKGAWDCMRKTYRTEGLRAFSKGFMVITLRAFVSNALVFWSYEKSSVLLADYVI